MRALVFSIDDAYVMPFKVLWHSLMKTKSVPAGTPIYILHEVTLSQGSIADLQSFLQRYSFAVEFSDASSMVPNDLPLKPGDHVSKATFYRLFVASILPDSIDSAVYMDSDMLAVRCLRDLFEFQVEKSVVAADHLSYSNALRLWGEAGGNYFQAGLLIIDLVAWRRRSIETRFLEIMKNERDRILWWDQDVLNIAFADGWQRLPVGYNFGAAASIALKGEVLSIMPRLLHFDGSNKPWKGDNRRPFASQWYEAYEQVFGRPFDLASVGRPAWRRFLSMVKARVRLLLWGP